MKTKIILLIVVVQLFSCNVFSRSNPSNKLDNLNTASSANYLSDFEKELVFEINRMRSNPAKYAKTYIAPLVKNYNGRLFYYPGDDPLKTKEGVRAMKECIRALSKASPLPLMYPSKGLSKAAGDHVKDQSRSGKTGHTGRDRSNVKARIERYGNWDVRIAENIAYGGKTPRQVVIYLLVDDGVRNRGHRTTFLHPAYKTVGVAAGSHPKYDVMCVMDFAGGFEEK